jgi:hypothetical protein
MLSGTFFIVIQTVVMLNVFKVSIVASLKESLAAIFGFLKRPSLASINIVRVLDFTKTLAASVSLEYRTHGHSGTVFATPFYL